MLQTIQNVKNLIGSDNPDQAVIKLAKTNPKFKKFYDENKNNSIDEISQKYGVDLNALSSLIK